MQQISNQAFGLYAAERTLRLSAGLRPFVSFLSLLGAAARCSWQVVSSATSFIGGSSADHNIQILYGVVLRSEVRGESGPAGRPAGLTPV